MKKPIRVLQVVINMNAGGIENMLMNLYRGIDKDKVQFDFLLHTKEKCFFDDEIIAMGGKIHRLYPIRLHNLKKYMNDTHRFFQEHDYKIIHSHMNIWSYFILNQAKRNKIPFRLAHSHIAYDSIWELPKQRVPFVYILKKLINTPLTHRFACGEAAGKWLYGDKEFTVINNAIQSERFIYNPEKSKEFKQLLKIEDKVCFGHVGRFNAQKNHDFLIDIFADIKTQIPNAVLVLLGDGNLKAQIEEKVKDKNLQENVLFLGIQKNVNDYLQAFDYFLMPSLFEGLPVSLVEAQANGLKVFASDQITSETDVTGHISFLPIDSGTKIWVDEVLKFKDFQKTNTKEMIVNAGYDIQRNAASMQDFYISALSNLPN